MTLTEDDARRRDEADPGHRELFHVPPGIAYFAGNSLGLQPKATVPELLADLDDWARLGVEGHLEGGRPWLPYHELLTGPAARLVGALPSEAVVMNSLTVNLHLLMVSFYRPAGARTQILIEDTAFPSDSYAVRSQARFHGLDPDTTVVRLASGQDVLTYLREHGERVALVLLGGVNYLTGELLDIPGITRAGQAAGAVVGWDLAHAAGNVPLRLHDWGVDFAAWCSYKYLNGGPGALAGVFIHERHVGDRSLPRLEGWWSTEPTTRFEMTPVSRPPATADAWQISNPPIFAMGPVRTSLEIFDRIGMDALRARSLRLTGYLRELFDEVTPGRPLEVVTPREPERHGCQLSVRIGDGALSVEGALPVGARSARRGAEGRIGPPSSLRSSDRTSPAPGAAGDVTRRLRHEHGVIADEREPDIVRFAPVPLYSTYHDCWRAARALAAVVKEV